MAEYGKIEDLTESLKVYINTSYELHKFEALERSSVIGASMISGLVMGIIGMFFLLFISLAAGFYVSSLLGNSYSGFGIIAAFYLLLGLILVLGRKKIMEQPIRESIIRQLFSNHE